MKLCIALLLLSASLALGAKDCGPLRSVLREDIKENVRSLFSLEENTTIKFVESLDEDVPRSDTLAALELISRERVMDNQDIRKKCPESVTEVYKVKTQNQFRACVGILRLQLPERTYDLIHLNCGSN